MLTPVALMEGMRFAESAFGPDGPAVPNYDLIPAAVFSDPELGTVGWTEEQAIQHAGEPVDVYLSTFKPLKYTMVEGTAQRTLMKMIVGKESDKVLGVHMVGAERPKSCRALAWRSRPARPRRTDACWHPSERRGGVRHHAHALKDGGPGQAVRRLWRRKAHGRARRSRVPLPPLSHIYTSLLVKPAA